MPICKFYICVWYNWDSLWSCSHHMLLSPGFLSSCHPLNCSQSHQKHSLYRQLHDGWPKIWNPLNKSHQSSYEVYSNTLWPSVILQLSHIWGDIRLWASESVLRPSLIAGAQARADLLRQSLLVPCKKTACCWAFPLLLWDLVGLVGNVSRVSLL